MISVFQLIIEKYIKKAIVVGSRAGKLEIDMYTAENEGSNIISNCVQELNAYIEVEVQRRLEDARLLGSDLVSTSPTLSHKKE